MITVELTDEQAEALVDLLDEHEMLPEVLDLLLEAIPHEEEVSCYDPYPIIDQFWGPSGSASAGFQGYTTFKAPRPTPTRSTHGFGQAVDIAMKESGRQMAKEMSFNLNYGAMNKSVLFHEDPITLDKLKVAAEQFRRCSPSA